MTGGNIKLHLNLGSAQAFCSSRLMQEPNSANTSLPQIAASYAYTMAAVLLLRNVCPPCIQGERKRSLSGRINLDTSVSQQDVQK